MLYRPVEFGAKDVCLPARFRYQPIERNSRASTSRDSRRENRLVIASGGGSEKVLTSIHFLFRNRKGIQHNAPADGDHWRELPDDKAVARNKQKRRTQAKLRE